MLLKQSRRSGLEEVRRRRAADEVIDLGDDLFTCQSGARAYPLGEPRNVWRAARSVGTRSRKLTRRFFSFGRPIYPDCDWLVARGCGMALRPKTAGQAPRTSVACVQNVPRHPLSGMCGSQQHSRITKDPERRLGAAEKGHLRKRTISPKRCCGRLRLPHHMSRGRIAEVDSRQPCEDNTKKRQSWLVCAVYLSHSRSVQAVTMYPGSTYLPSTPRKQRGQMIRIRTPQ